jgi:hypothetical protein
VRANREHREVGGAEREASVAEFGRRSTTAKAAAANPADPFGPDGARSVEGRHERWSQRVTETSNALDLEPGVFALEDPHAVAASLKVSADRSERRKSSPFASAMRMLTFYINRAGRTLSADRRAVLEQAKIELRILYGKKKIRLRNNRSSDQG